MGQAQAKGLLVLCSKILSVPEKFHQSADRGPFTSAPHHTGWALIDRREVRQNSLGEPELLGASSEELVFCDLRPVAI